MFILTSCEYELDTTREINVRGTLGEEVYRVLKKDLNRYKPLKGIGFEREKSKFINAFDSIFPAEQNDVFHQFLISMLPYYENEQNLSGNDTEENGRVQNVIRRTGCLLKDLANETDSLKALDYLSYPEGYDESELLYQVLYRFLNHDGINEFLDDLKEIWLMYDGLDSSFNPSNENDVLVGLQSEISLWLKDLSINEPELSEKNYFINWLFNEDEKLLLDNTVNPLFIVRTDERGRAIVKKSDSGNLVEPFVDNDGDKKADINSEYGEFIDAIGNKLNVLPPFDSNGIKNTVNDLEIYEYTDLNKTNLAAILYQLEPFIKEKLIWELRHFVPHLTGPKSPRIDEKGAYEGFDPEKSVIMSFYHAVIKVLDYDRLPELIESVLALLELNENDITSLINTFDKISEIADNYPDRSLTENNSFLDELLPLLTEALDKGYLLTALRNFADDRIYDMQKGMADVIRFSDSVSDDNMIFNEPTNFYSGDFEYSKRSNLQRLMHLCHDTNNISYTSTIIGYDAYTIHDMLAFYLDSLSGYVSVPGYVSFAVTEFSSNNPTTEEVNRFMNHNHTFLGNPFGREGHPLYQYNGDSLLAIELSGFMESFKPFADAFVSSDRTSSRMGTKVLADIMEKVHPHYSPGLPFASTSSANLRALEPIILDVLDNTDMLNEIIRFVNILNNLHIESGNSVLQEVDLFLKFLLKNDNELLTFKGSQSVTGFDNTTAIAPLNRLYLLNDALRELDNSVKEDENTDQALTKITDFLKDQFFEIEQINETWQFKNRQAFYLTRNIIYYLKDRVNEHWQNGTRLQNLEDLKTDLSDIIGGRILPKLIDVLDVIIEHETFSNELDNLLLNIFDKTDEKKKNEYLKMAARLVQLIEVDKVIVPISNMAGKYLDPEIKDYNYNKNTKTCELSENKSTLISRSLSLLHELSNISVNDNRYVDGLIKRLGTKYSNINNSFPLRDIVDVISSVHKVNPKNVNRLNYKDYEYIMIQTIQYIFNEQRGVEKLYKMVKTRNDAHKKL